MGKMQRICVWIALVGFLSACLLGVTIETTKSSWTVLVDNVTSSSDNTTAQISLASLPADTAKFKSLPIPSKSIVNIQCLFSNAAATATVYVVGYPGLFTYGGAELLDTFSFTASDSVSVYGYYATAGQTVDVKAYTRIKAYTNSLSAGTVIVLGQQY